MNPLSTTLHLVTQPEFLSGVVAGGAAAVLLLAVGRERLDWGLVWVAAGLAAWYWSHPASLLTVIPGLVGEPWVPAAVAAAVWAAAAGMTPMTHPWLPGAGLAITVGGVWATVPDTEAIAVLVGVTLALFWLWWPARLARPGTMGGVAVALLLAAATATGAWARPPALVGGLGSLASVAVFALKAPWLSGPARILIHTALVLGWSRFAGRAGSVATAVAIGVAMSAVVLMTARATARLMGTIEISHDR